MPRRVRRRGKRKSAGELRARRSRAANSGRHRSDGRSRRRIAPAAWAGIAALAVILGLISDATNLVSLFPGNDSSSHLQGDLNIAVARFRGTGSSRAADRADRVSDSLVLALRRRYESRRGPLAPGVEVAGWREIGGLGGGSLDQAELDRLNAAVGVTGTLRDEPQVTVLGVDLRINLRQLHLARQIDPVIHRRIRMAGVVGESLATQVRISNKLATSVEAVTDLLFGLGELESEHPASARRLLNHVLANGAVTQGAEVLYLMRGHALAVEHNDERARASYMRALAIRPNFARARFALAALEFRRGAADCTRGRVYAAKLRRARREFAAIAPDAAPVLRAKALFARARVDVCLSQAGLARRFDTARKTLIGVVSAYRRGVPEIRAEAAESLGWLAFIALPSRTASGRAPAGIAAAVRNYRAAASLAVDPSRRQFFNRKADQWADRAHSDSEVAP